MGWGLTWEGPSWDGVSYGRFIRGMGSIWEVYSREGVRRINAVDQLDASQSVFFGT